MVKNKLGEVLYWIRREKKVEQDKLCFGLCTRGFLSKVENGERQPDRLLLHALVQRLGKDVDKMVTVLTAEEYQYFLWKRRALEAAGDADMAHLKSLLEEPEAQDIIINENLQRQFVCQMQALVAEHTGKGDLQCIRFLEQALQLTLPGIIFEQLDDYLISLEELGILLKLAGYLVRTEKKGMALRMLLEIVSYADQKYDDYEAKVKIYPKAVRMAAPLLSDQGRLAEGMVLCRKAIKLLCRLGILYDLTELMEAYLTFASHLTKTKEITRYEKQCRALWEIYEEYGTSYGHGLKENTLLSYSNQEIYLLNEVIQRSRMEKKISQEALSEGICSPETLSRLETGKRAPNPRNFRALMKKLETGQDYYNPKLDTVDFKLLEKHKELERAMTVRDWERAWIMLEDLKGELDMSSSRNRRTLQTAEKSILLGMGRILPEEFLKYCEEELQCGEKGWKKEEFWKQFFTNEKVNLLNHIALCYEKKKQYKESIFILEKLGQQLRDSKVRLIHRYNAGMTVAGNLASYYNEVGKFEQSLEMCEKGMELCMESGRGLRISNFLCNKAEAINEKENKATDISRRYLEQAFYISDLFSTNSVTRYINDYYRKYYDADVSWY